MREVKRRLHLSEWRKLLEERVLSGQSIDAWCEDHGVSRNMYCYWQRLLREAALSSPHFSDDIALPEPVIPDVQETEMAIADVSPVFTKIPKPLLSSTGTPAMGIRIGGIFCEVYNEAGIGLVENVLRMLRRL